MILDLRGNIGVGCEGFYNTGNRNSGNRNTGIWNSGSWNSGNCNTGNRNSGDWNKCDFSNGCFNTKTPKIYLFNKPSEWTYQDWSNSEACHVLNYMPGFMQRHIFFHNMTDEEKATHPYAEETGGYIQIIEEGNRQEWWNKLSAANKKIIQSIPNFDKAIFKEITGIDVEEEA